MEFGLLRVQQFVDYRPRDLDVVTEHHQIANSCFPNAAHVCIF